MNISQLKLQFENHPQYEKIVDLIDNALDHIEDEDENNLSPEFINGVKEYISELNNFDSDLLF